MKVSTERIPDAQVLMTIEVEPERLDAAREKALRKLSPRAKVPGFRPGKAPPAMVRRYFGEERILDEALDIVVPDVYKEAVEADESIDPIARPRLVVETTEPLVVKATIPVRPTVELGDYHAIRIPAEEVTIDESRVEETLTLLRRRAATLEPVERPLQWRDIVRMDVKATVGDEPFVEQQEVEVQLVEDRDVLIPGFEEQLLGHVKGETVEFDLDVPAEGMPEQFAGKQAHVTVEIRETKEEVLPELDEEFAKAVGDGYESVDALRERIRADIRRAEEERRDDRYHDAILTKLVEQAQIEFPPVLLESEIDRLFHDQAGHLRDREQVERYLAAIGKTEQEVRDELRPIADARLRRSLALSKVTELEGITVDPSEVDAEIDRMTQAAGQQGDRLRQMFDSPDGRDTIRRNLVTRKTLARLVEIATQDGAEPSAAAGGEPEPEPGPKVAKPKADNKKTSEATAEAPAAVEATPDAESDHNA